MGKLYTVFKKTIFLSTLLTLHSAFSNVSYAKDTVANLPRDDIRRFVTAIAVIHHYYINQITDKHLFSDAIRGMVETLDPHSSYLDEEALKELTTDVSGEFVGIGVELTLQDGLLKVISPLDGSPAQKSGIKPNDFIMKVNGTLIQQMSLDDAIRKIKGKPGTQVALTIVRPGKSKPIQVSVLRDTIQVHSVQSKLLAPGYGYIHISFFQGPVEHQLRASLKQLKEYNNKKDLDALVLDLRDNPGGLLDISASVADDFLDSRQLKQYNSDIVYTKGRTPDSDLHIKATPDDLIHGIPMVVLINGGSASASEIVAGALQDYHRAIIMGTRSFGKGSVQTILPLDDQGAIKLTTALYYTPAGRVIQARGIIPDITVPQLLIQNSKESKDLSIDESEFQNHLPTPDEKTESQNDTRKEEKQLASEDYQLYEALIMLEGLHASQTPHQEG